MNTQIIYITIYCLWLVYACYEGYNEANYWYRLSGTTKSATNEHAIWTVGRAIVGLIVLVPIFYLTANIWLTLLFGASLVLGFSFFHDGYYYAERNELDGSYPHGFWSFSTTSTSWMDKHGLTTALARIIYFAISLTIIIIFFIWKKKQIKRLGAVVGGMIGVIALIIFAAYIVRLILGNQISYDLSYLLGIVAVLPIIIFVAVIRVAIEDAVDYIKYGR